MIQKTKEERELLKKAKKSYKEAELKRKKEMVEDNLSSPIKSSSKGKKLPNDYIIHAGFLYYMDDTLIESDIAGFVSELKRYLIQKYSLSTVPVISKAILKFN